MRPLFCSNCQLDHKSKGFSVDNMPSHQECFFLIISGIKRPLFVGKFGSVTFQFQDNSELGFISPQMITNFFFHIHHRQFLVVFKTLILQNTSIFRSNLNCMSTKCVNTNTISLKVTVSLSFRFTTLIALIPNRLFTN